ncbi:hypothetical protein H8S61_04995 [Eggerthella sp. NSJ-70]|uniref:Uncharacterized protein n=1 Tax=Eggerthella hominis TaxID=2763043 RepID=A0ABR7BPK8_9ACTN|nr:hypothetical protein [Eggerthella hominis]MBC5583551.1 hypothetical protein [Eggerthella hominis]
MKRRSNKRTRPERRIACGVAAVAALVVASVAFFGWRTYERIADAAPDGASTIELQVALRCDGWSPENVELGAFVSGVQIDGAPCDEQLVFEGSGAQTAYLGAGSYEVVPQLPMLMLFDGTVLAAGDPVARSYGDDAPKTDALEIAYAAIDARDLAEDELRAVADGSFATEDDADAAFGRALARWSEEAAHAEA